MKRGFVLVAALALMALPSVPSDASTGSAGAGGAAASGAKAGATAGTAGATARAKPRKWKPAPGAWFNTPRHGAKQWVLHSHIVAGIDHARKGSYIRIALFSFDRQYVAEKLVRAHRRGVHVQVLLNDHQVTPAQRLLHRALGTNRWRKSFAYECHHGCRSGGENLHTKFYLFSHTGGARDTVMTGSVNLTGNSAMNQYNDLLVLNDAAKLTRTFGLVWKQMRRDRRAHPAWFRHRVNNTFLLEATPFPNPGPRHDPIISILDKVKCLGATGPTGTPAHHTVVRAVMHAWNDPRGTYIAKKMRALYAKGCDVKLMYGFAGESVRHTFATRTKRGFMPIHTTGKDTNGDGFIDLYTHQKELLISGHYGGSRHTRLVVTGSSNYNTEGVRGDEELILINNRPGTWHDYISDFSRMWTNPAFSTRVKYIPYPNAVARGTTTERGFTLGRALSEFGSSSDLTVAPGPLPGGPAWEGD